MKNLLILSILMLSSWNLAVAQRRVKLHQTDSPNGLRVSADSFSSCVTYK